MKSENTAEIEQKFKKMTEKPITPLVIQMAIPSIISMLVSAFYNLADNFFIAKISTQASGAVGVVFSYMAVAQALAFFFGHGSGNYISRELGAKHIKNAEKMASVGFFSAIISGIILMLPCLFFMEPILLVLGSTKTILPLAKDYFFWILLSTPFIMGSFVMNNQLRLQGNAKYGMIGIMSGAVLNVLLDPLLIFTFNMGITGAALATAISQFAGFTVLLIMCNSSGIKISIKNYKPNKIIIVEIIACGLPSLLRQGLAGLSTVCLNNAAGVYGDSAIAAFTIIGRVSFIATAAMLGFGQGFQPICGFNYGAKLYDRVKKAFWCCIKITFFILLGFAILGFVFSDPIISAFRSEDKQLIEIGSLALKLQCLTLPLSGFIVISNMFLQNTRKTVRATVLAVSRQGLVFIPLLFIFSAAFGLLGIQISQPVADVFTFLLSIPLGLSGLREMERLKSQNI